jgi:hypothetical protein
MNNGTDDVTGVHDEAEAKIHAEAEDSVQHLLAAIKAVQEARGDTKAAQYAFDDRQSAEDRYALRHIPVELDAAVDDEEKGSEEDQHEEDQAGIQPAEGVEVQSIAELDGLSSLDHRAEFEEASGCSVHSA